MLTVTCVIESPKRMIWGHTTFFNVDIVTATPDDFNSPQTARRKKQQSRSSVCKWFGVQIFESFCSTYWNLSRS